MHYRDIMHNTADAASRTVMSGVLCNMSLLSNASRTPLIIVMRSKDSDRRA